MSDETVRQVLRGTDYRFLHSRKKGLLKKAILKRGSNLPVKLLKC